MRAAKGLNVQARTLGIGPAVDPISQRPFATLLGISAPAGLAGAGMVESARAGPNIRRRFTKRGLLIALVAVTLLGADDPTGALRELLPEERMVPDPSVKVVPRYQADGPRRRRVGVSGPRGLHGVREVLQGRRSAGVAALEKSRGLARVTKGTPVLVLRDYRPNKESPKATVFSNDEELARTIQREAFLSRPPDRDDYPVEVRVTRGELNDRVVFVLETSIVPVPGSARDVRGSC